MMIKLGEVGKELSEKWENLNIFPFPYFKTKLGGVMGEEKLIFQLNSEFGLFPEMDIFANGLRVSVEF